jgi:hypothetical protein
MFHAVAILFCFFIKGHIFKFYKIIQRSITVEHFHGVDTAVFTNLSDSETRKTNINGYSENRHTSFLKFCNISNSLLMQLSLRHRNMFIYNMELTLYVLLNYKT